MLVGRDEMGRFRNRENELNKSVQEVRKKVKWGKSDTGKRLFYEVKRKESDTKANIENNNKK